jgi:hypothetical protein
MKQVSVLLDSVEKIRSFVDIIEKSEADADLSQGSRHVDAKSLFGALSIVSNSPAMKDAVGLYARLGYTRMPNYPPYDKLEGAICFQKQLRI